MTRGETKSSSNKLERYFRATSVLDYSAKRNGKDFSGKEIDSGRRPIDPGPMTVLSGLEGRNGAAELQGRPVPEEVYSRDRLKLERSSRGVNSLLKRLFLTRNCLKLVYTDTAGTPEIDSHSPPPPGRPMGCRMRLIFLLGYVYSP